MNKFEKLIEYIINDEDQKARDLFHDIVVEKSRDIYESIMDEESMEENFEHPAVAGDEVEDMVQEVGTEEAMGEDDEEGAEMELGDDQDGEDTFGDEEGEEPAFGGEHEEQDEVEHKVMNIDAKLDELLAKFDEIMGHDDPAGEEPGMGAEEPMHHEEPEMAEEMYEAEEDCDDEDKEEDKEDDKEESKGNPFAKKKTDEARTGAKSATELMREYVETIGDIYGGQGDTAEGTAVGSSGKKTAVNTKPGSVGPGANFGGTVVKATGPTSNQDGTTPTKASNEYNKGQGEIKSGNRNVPGGKAGSPESTGKEYSKEHGAEGQTTDGKLPVAKKSVQVQNTGKK
jgi:hypothetical protein